MRHLFELGHRDIVHIANRGAGDAEPDTPHGDWIRRQTYERMMVEAGLAEHVKVVESRFDDHSACHSMRELLRSGHMPTAVFAGADDAAFGDPAGTGRATHGAATSIAVVGYDNTRFADHPNMSLTSVDQHGRDWAPRGGPRAGPACDEAGPPCSRCCSPGSSPAGPRCDTAVWGAPYPLVPHP